MTKASNTHCSDHSRHVGVCPACQRERLAAERRQLAHVDEIIAGARALGITPDPRVATIQREI